LREISNDNGVRLVNFATYKSLRDVRQTEVHTAEPLIPGPSRLEVDISVAKFKKCKSPGNDQIPAELIQAGGEILLSAIHKLINSVWNKEELPDQWKESIIVPIKKRVIKLTNNYRGISLLSTSYKVLSNILLSRLDLLGYIVDTIKKNTETLIDASKEVGLKLNVDKTKYMLLSHHQNVGQNREIKIANRLFGNVSQLRYFGTTVTNQNLIQERIKRRLISGHVCYHLVQKLLSSRLLSKNLKTRIYAYKTIILPVVLYGC
jgi:hypothetical protein